MSRIYSFAEIIEKVIDFVPRIWNERVDMSRWDFSQFHPENKDSFAYEYGVTPMTEPVFIAQMCIMYLTTIFVGRMIMSGIKPFKLKWLTTVHNGFLCLWSAYMAYGIGSGLLEIYKENGTMWAIWLPQNHNGRTGSIGFFFYHYCMSKYLELFDTILIVLKKKPLIFLHVYHHTIVMPLMNSWLYEGMLFGYWGAFLNCCVHVLMYFYYAIANLGYRPWWKKYITNVQIIQFIIAISTSIPGLIYGYTLRTETNYGMIGYYGFLAGESVTVSFLYLFLVFRAVTYKTPKRKVQ